ncbi:hypothetical protein [Streptomyces sp. NPDC086519]|uniref:hypothetical protein n=1 Tax=Streptomyces sp. NPDC086519 TaxID=3154863 RepID=UPI00341A50C1
MSTPYQQAFNTPVEQLRATFQRGLDNVRARQDLTPQAREVAIARAYRAARDGLARAQQSDADRYRRQRALLERQLFGGDDSSGYNALSARDAREKAAQLTDPREAHAAFQRAQRDGDTDYAKAIAARAADLASQPIVGQAWQPIVASYVQGNDRRAKAYQELAELADPSSGLDFTYILPKPREIDAYQDHQIDAIAGSDLGVYGDGPQAA